MPGSCQITHRLHAFYSFFEPKYALKKQSEDEVINKKPFCFKENLCL